MDRKFTRAELILTLVLALALCAVCQAVYAEHQPIRVGLTRFSHAKQLTVRASSSCSLKATAGGQLLAAAPAQIPLILTPGLSAITIAGLNGAPQCTVTSVTMASDDPTAVLSVEMPGCTARYRGRLEINLKNGALQVINVISVEDYLLGVLPRELGQGNPDQALRAQAVAARTYALRNHSKHGSSGYGVCDTDDCQCYGGASCEQPQCSRAVQDTRGLVLTYNGELAHVQYSADCGGVTENYAELYSRKDCAYLCGVVEPDCVQHPPWEKSFTLQSLSAILLKSGIQQAQGLQSVTITRTTPSGRALEVEIKGANGTAVTGGEKLRKILGLRSRLYCTECADGKITFRGRGWGHGIGLCQLGARALARPPLCYTYDRILAHYFPGATLSNLNGTNPAPPAITSPPVDVVAVQPSAPPRVTPKPTPAPKSPPRIVNRRVGLDLQLEEPHL